MFEHEESAEQEGSQESVVAGNGGDAEQQDSRQEAVILEVNVIHHEETSIAQQ